MAISIVDHRSTGDGRIFCAVFCTSQDTKPTGEFATGVPLIEVDTGAAFFYDQGAEAWFPKDGSSTPTVKVSFDMQGHGTQVDDINQTWNTAATAPTPPTETGYTFGGWYTDPACENAWTWTDKVLNEMTLYAKWTAVEYTITYNLDGGTNSPNNPAKFTIETPDIVFEPATKEDYDFDGWYTNGSFTTKMTGITKGTHTNKNTYAKFTAQETEE